MADLIARKRQENAQQLLRLLRQLCAEAALIRPREKEITTRRNRYSRMNNLLNECVLLTLCSREKQQERSAIGVR